MQGVLQMDKPQATMLGGFILNVTAACFQTTDVLKLQIDEKTMDCERVFNNYYSNSLYQPVLLLTLVFSWTWL